MGVRDRGLERGRFMRRGDGLLVRSASGDVTAAPVDRLNMGEECLMSNSSMGAFAATAGPVVVSLCSGMLSERCIRLDATSRGLANGEASLPPLPFIVVVVFVVDC